MGRHPDRPVGREDSGGGDRGRRPPVGCEVGGILWGYRFHLIHRFGFRIVPVVGRRRWARRLIAWAMVATGVVFTLVGLLVTVEPVALVIMSGAALVFEGILAVFITHDDD